MSEPQKFQTDNSYPIFPFEKSTKSSMQNMRIYLNASLNCNGGNLVFGIDKNSHIMIGVPLSLSQKDEVRLAVDAFINAFVPQIDNDYILTTFIELGQFKNDTNRKLYVVCVTAHPSYHPIVFTSTAHSEAFSFDAHNIPIRLQPEQLLQRQQYPRDQCLKAEKDVRALDEQQTLIDASIDFVKRSTKPTRIIVIEGPKNSGKSWIVQRVFMQLEYATKVFVDFKNHNYANDVYVDMIDQLIPEQKLKMKTITLDLEPLISPRAATNIDEPEDTLATLLRGPIENMPTRCPVLRNILFNESMRSKALIAFDSVFGRIDDFINKGAQVTYIIACEDYRALGLDSGPAMEICHFQTDELGVTQLTKILKSKGLSVLEVEVQGLLKQFGYNVQRLQYFLETGQDLAANHTTINETVQDLLKKLVIVPGRFSLKFIESQIGVNNMKTVSPYLIKHKEHFSIPMDIRQEILLKMDQAVIKEYGILLIDFVCADVKQLNIKQQNQFHNGSKLQNFDIMTKLIAMEINDTVFGNLSLITEAIKKSIQYEYKCQELHNLLCVFISSRVPVGVLDLIQQMRFKYGFIGSSDE